MRKSTSNFSTTEPILRCNIIAAMIGFFSFAGNALALDGAWARPWIDDLPGYFHRFTHSFDAQNYDVISTTVIERPSRGNYIFDAVTTLSYRLGSLLRTEGGIKIYEFDTITVRQSMRPRTYSTAGMFWQKRECDYSDWQVDVAVDVSNRNCASLVPVAGVAWQAGVKTFQIIGIGTDKVYLGDLDIDPSKDGQTAARRPDKLVLDIPLLKTTID